jgi:hypothetical protein
MKLPFVIEIRLPVERLSPIAAAVLGALAMLAWLSLGCGAYWSLYE